MGYVRYTALRNLAPSHIVDFEYELNVPAIITRRLLVDKEVIKAEGGQTITLFNREELSWSIRTKVFGQSLVDQVEHIREFLSSVSRGESFSFIPDGVIGGDGNVFPVILDGSNWSEERVGIRNNYRYTFIFRVLP